VVNTHTVGFTVNASTTVFMLAVTTSAPTVTTAATVYNNVIGTGRSPLGQCYRVATLSGNPFMIRIEGTTAISASAAGAGLGQFTDHIDGEIVLPPGVGLVPQTTAAATILATFGWEEVAQ
jgi:hypothetical protein